MPRNAPALLLRAGPVAGSAVRTVQLSGATALYSITAVNRRDTALVVGKGRHLPERPPAEDHGSSTRIGHIQQDGRFAYSNRGLVQTRAQHVDAAR